MQQISREKFRSLQDSHATWGDSEIFLTEHRMAHHVQQSLFYVNNNEIAEYSLKLKDSRLHTLLEGHVENFSHLHENQVRILQFRPADMGP